MRSSFVLVSIACLVSQAASFQSPFFQARASAINNNNKANAIKLLEQLEGLIGQAPKNGIDTPTDLEQDILQVCEALEGCNPTKAPARNTLMMNGFWNMRWTNFSPANNPSSGKLGPLVGDVFQDIDLSNGFARNILRVTFPPIVGELFADPAVVVNDSTVSITFKSVGNKLAGVLPFGPKIQFEAGKEVRLWEHVYLDDEYRILYARRQEDSTRGFAYVMKRADDERFETNV
jgi:hypothetical protein